MILRAIPRFAIYRGRRMPADASVSTISVKPTLFPREVEGLEEIRGARGPEVAP